VNKFLYLLIFLFPALSTAQQLAISVPVPVEYLKKKESFNKFDSLLKRFNYEPNYRFQPRLRGLSEVNRGIIDGEYARSDRKLDQFPHIILVREPVTKTKIVAFYLKKNIVDIHDLTSLKHYSVGYVEGWVMYKEAALHGRSHVAVSDTNRLIKMLIACRFDVVVLEQGLGESIVRSLGLPSEQFASSKVLHTPLLYFLLNKKHSVLRDKLEAALRAQ